MTPCVNQLLAYTYITVKFQLRINVRLMESYSIIGFALKGPPKWGFGVILGVGAKTFGRKVFSVRRSLLVGYLGRKPRCGEVA